jgi:hypothetical protein
MEKMYQLLGCGDGETGYIFPTTDATCYHTDYGPDSPQTRTCPVHGAENLRLYAAEGWNDHEAVFYVNGVYYAVKVTKNTDPFQIIKTILDNPANYQAWLYSDNPAYACTDPGPYPQELPSQ